MSQEVGDRRLGLRVGLDAVFVLRARPAAVGPEGAGVAGALLMPPGANGWQGQSTGWENSTSSAWALGPGARAPSAMPLNKAAPGPKMNGYHNETSTGVIGPHGRNDAVLYDRNQSGVPMQSHMWSMQGQMNMRHSGFPDGGRMQGMPSLRPPSSGDVGLVESMDGLQLSIGGSDSGMTRGQRPKLSEGERQEETDDDMFAMFRFKVCDRAALGYRCPIKGEAVRRA